MNNFCKTLDTSDVGVHAGNKTEANDLFSKSTRFLLKRKQYRQEMRRVNELLKEKDPALWADLESKGFFAEFSVCFLSRFEMMICCCYC